MKRSFPYVFFILQLLLNSSLILGQQGTFSQYLDHPWVDSVLTTLSREEKIAQSLWILSGPDNELHELLEFTSSFSDHGPGGVIYSASPNEQMKELADYCRSVGPLAPVIALEGRWSGQYPDMITLAAIDSDSLRYMAGANLAAQLAKEGISLLLKKDLDDDIAAGLSEQHIQILDPELILAARIGEIDKCMDAEIADDSIEHRARQALALKYWIKQQDAEAGKEKQEDISTDGPAQKAFSRDLYAHSMTVLNNREDIIPIKDLEKIRIACLAVNQQNQTRFQQMAGLYTQCDNYNWTPGNENTELLVKMLATYDLVLAGLYPGQNSKATADMLSSLEEETKLVVVCFGDPASPEQCLSSVSDLATLDPEGLILSYELNPVTEGLSAQLIFGGIGGRGSLPQAIGDQYPAGHGIATPGGIRLQYGYPENAGLCSRDLNRAIDSIVTGGLDAGAYPGCQVIVARKGTVVFHKAYGYHTYEKRIEVRKNDLYDLASVTKVSGPLSGLMLLEGMGKFSYRDRLGDYCDAMKGSDKADLALKDILAHRAGLYPWIPYHENTLKKNGKYKKRFIRQDAEEKFNIQVADRVYLSNTYKDKIFKEIRKSELGEQEYRYSGLSFFLFPTIIEKLSGQPYETFLAEQIYQRLGAWELLFHPRSAFPASRIVPTEYDSLFRKQLVHGYVHDEGAALMGAYAGNAGLFASSNDLLKLIEMYRRMGSYGGEQIIPSEVLREYSSYQFPELEIRRGLGFDKPLLNEYDGTPDDYPCPGASRSSFGHSGFTGTYVWADPEHEISYVFLSNRVHTTRTNQLLYEMDIRTNILQSVIDSIKEP
jgi:CubicO group peptidase (beta-lactamase class C family)